MQTTKLIRSDLVAEGTRAFQFEKPEGFAYAAGQTIDLTLINPPETDAEGNTRTFSITSAPSDDFLMIATRMRDTAFKRVLGAAITGTELTIEGPFGSFTLHENTKRPAVFLAGGIGITPFHSIIKDAAIRKLPHTLFLFYSNRRPEDASFLKELQNFEKENNNYTFVGTMTDMTHSKMLWDGEAGYIDSEMIQKYISLETLPIFYMAGPPAMVAAMRKLLNGMGVSNDDIRFEEFAGY